MVKCEFGKRSRWAIGKMLSKPRSEDAVVNMIARLRKLGEIPMPVKKKNKRNGLPYNSPLRTRASAEANWNFKDDNLEVKD